MCATFETDLVHLTGKRHRIQEFIVPLPSLPRAHGKALATQVATVVKRRARELSLARHDRRIRATLPGTDTALPAAAPSPARKLPARHVPLTDPWTHRASLVESITAALDAAHVRHVNVPGAHSAQIDLGIADTDWIRAMQALRLADLPGLIATTPRPRAQPSSLPYSPLKSTVGASPDHPVAIVLDPAITIEDGRVVARYGFETAVRLQRWAPGQDPMRNTHLLVPPVRNRFTDGLDPAAFEGDTEALAPLTTPTLFEPTFPIDAVYTWVDGTDPAWLERKRDRLEALTGYELTEAASEDLRFIAHDELRHSLRSLERYAPWIRHIYLVTDGQRPDWLREDHPRITVVDHREISAPGTDLPTYNSQAIEANLHRIDGLAEHFIYLNDDFFFSSTVAPDLFFAANGLASLFMSRAQVGPGAPRPDEPASDTAGKNARAMVEEVCGRRVSQKFFHAPYAMRRSIAAEIEERWPQTVAFTRESVFRRTGDVTLAGALQLNYAFATGRGQRHGVRYRYVNIGSENTPTALEKLWRDRDRLQTFCLNESSSELAPAQIDHLVRTFLARRFPDKSTFEK